MGRKKTGRKKYAYQYRKRIVAKFELDEFEFLINKKGNKTWNEFILELAGYKKKENKVEVESNGGYSK